MELIKNKEEELAWMLKHSKSLFKLFIYASPEELKKKMPKTFPKGLYDLFEMMVKQDVLEGIETQEEIEYLKLLEKEGIIRKEWKMCHFDEVPYQLYVALFILALMSSTVRQYSLIYSSITSFITVIIVIILVEFIFQFIDLINKWRKCNSKSIVVIRSGRGPPTQAQINGVMNIALKTDGSLYIADYINNRVLRVGPDGIITTVAGNGVPGLIYGEYDWLKSKSI